MIDVFEYMRLADDGCPHTPGDVPMHPDANPRFEWADGYVLMNVPIRYQDFVFTTHTVLSQLRNEGTLSGPQ